MLRDQGRIVEIRDAEDGRIDVDVEVLDGKVITFYGCYPTRFTKVGEDAANLKFDMEDDYACT